MGTGIAKVSGLPGVGFDEELVFPGGVSGIAFNVDADEIGVILLGEYWELHAGDEVTRTGRVIDVGVGEGLLGRVIDPMGRPLDDQGPVASEKRLPVERPAPHHGSGTRHHSPPDGPQGHRRIDSGREGTARVDPR